MISQLTKSNEVLAKQSEELDIALASPCVFLMDLDCDRSWANAAWLISVVTLFGVSAGVAMGWFCQCSLAVVSTCRYGLVAIESR